MAVVRLNSATGSAASAAGFLAEAFAGFGLAAGGSCARPGTGETTVQRASASSETLFDIELPPRAITNVGECGTRVDGRD